MITIDAWATLSAWRKDPFAVACTYTHWSIMDTLTIGLALTEFFAMVRIEQAASDAWMAGAAYGARNR